MLYSVKKKTAEDMALNIAVPLSGVGGLSPISPLGIDCWENIKILCSPIGSESSGVSSLDSDDAKLPIQQLTPPKTPEDLKIMYQGRDILDLKANIEPNPKLWNLRYTHLPYNNIPMFLANRSQYHRLGENAHIQEYSLVKCEDCDFEYTVNRTSNFCRTSLTISPTTNSTMTYAKSGLSSSSTAASAAAAAVAACTTTSVARQLSGNQSFNAFQFQQQQSHQQHQHKQSSLQSHQSQQNAMQMQNKNNQMNMSSSLFSSNGNFQNQNNYLSDINILNSNFFKKATTVSAVGTPTKMLPPSMPMSAATSPTSSSGYSSSSSSIASVNNSSFSKYQNFKGLMNANNINISNNTNEICATKNLISNNSINTNNAAAPSNNLNTFYSFLNSLNKTTTNNAGTANNNNGNNILNSATVASNGSNYNNSNHFNNLNSSNSIYAKNNNNNNNNNHGMLLNGHQPQQQPHYARMYKYF